MWQLTPKYHVVLITHNTRRPSKAENGTRIDCTLRSFYLVVKDESSVAVSSWWKMQLSWIPQEMLMVFVKFILHSKLLSPILARQQLRVFVFVPNALPGCQAPNQNKYSQNESIIVAEKRSVYPFSWEPSDFFFCPPCLGDCSNHSRNNLQEEQVRLRLQPPSPLSLSLLLSPFPTISLLLTLSLTLSLSSVTQGRLKSPRSLAEIMWG